MKSDLKKVSIVMPVHNTPEYALRESLESIFEQELKDFELICVDDGSTDITTKDVLKEYERMDSRMRVIWLDKSIGCGGARNVGLQKIEGKYTIFLDSDDYFAPHYLIELLRCIEAENSDVCVTGYSMFNEDGNNKRIIGEHHLRRTYNSYLEDGDFLIEGTLSACNKLVKTDYIRQETIEFITTETDDDVLYGAMVLLCTNNISILDDAGGFFYRFNTGYQMSSHMNPLDLFAGLLKVREEMQKKGKENEDVICMINTYLIDIGILEMKCCREEEHNKKFYERTAYYLTDNNVKVKKKQAQVRLERWTTLPYESKWFELAGNFEAQLNNNRDEMLRLIGEMPKQIVLWGRGKRGLAFEKFAHENEIEISAVCDRDNKNCGLLDEYDVLIKNTDEVIKMEDVMVLASNDIILNYLNDIYGINAFSIEKYCEL